MKKVWTSTVNDIAKNDSGEDSNHPAATVTAGTNAENSSLLRRN